MGPSAAFVAGVLLGLLVAVALLTAVVRSVGRITGSDTRGVGRLITAGLVPGARSGGVAAQRALARRLRRTGQRTASGRRVAASEVELHVSPEDFALIDEAIGIERATDDLVDFYRAHASRSGWIVQGEPCVVLVRDISLRPRQAFARATVRVRQADRPVAPRPPARPRTGAVPMQPVEAVTDVLPRAVPDGSEPSDATRSYPTEELAAPAAGDLVIVHGTDVRTVSAARGAVRIGRAPHNDIVVDRPGVARDHVVVERRGDAWWIVPGTAPQGVTADGHVLDGPVEIRGQALLELGRGVRMRFTVEPPR